MSYAEQFVEKLDKATASAHPIILSWEFAGALAQELRSVAEYVAATQRMFAVSGDHMTACDRVMGATHPCTCGADAARNLLVGPSGGPYVPESDARRCAVCGGGGYVQRSPLIGVEDCPECNRPAPSSGGAS